MVTALGKTWHPEHFVCHVCKVELGTGKFFEREDVPFCEKDYHALFAPRCAYCEQPIVDVSAVICLSIATFLQHRHKTAPQTTTISEMYYSTAEDMASRTLPVRPLP